MTGKTFLAVDGDDVGRALEQYVVTSRIEELQVFFRSFQEGMIWLEKTLISRFRAEIIFNGGDNLMAILEADANLVLSLEEMRMRFYENTSKTLSFGVGASPRQCFLALKFAKSSGKNRMVLFSEIVNE